MFLPQGKEGTYDQTCVPPSFASWLHIICKCSGVNLRINRFWSFSIDWVISGQHQCDSRNMKSVADYKTPILMQLSLGSAFFERKYLSILFQEGVDSMNNEQTRVSRIRHALFFSDVETYLTPRTTNASHKKTRGEENCFSIKQSQKNRNSENFCSCILVSFSLSNNPLFCGCAKWI